MVDRESDRIEETIDFWERHGAGATTPAEADEIIANVRQFFGILMEWDSAARGSDRKLSGMEKEEGGQ